MVALALSVSVFLQLYLAGTTYALQCYNCSNIDAYKCSTLTECRTGQQCGVTAAGSLVGRDVSARQSPDCHECCGTDKCNKNLCVHLKLDGNWASWSLWSQCDATCENGTQTRTRACTDPTPSNGGLDCTGSNTETKPCLKELCPVNGSWTSWSNWGTCSVTCGVGIQGRNRNCSNPSPGKFGDHCFGNSLDVRICLPGPCASQNIVFKAKSVTDKTPSFGQTIIFGTTLVNEGNAYSTSTGIFTAPVKGTYSFSIQFCVYDGKALYIAIMVDGDTYAASLIYDVDSITCDTADTVAVLNAQSKVWVKCTYVTGSRNVIAENSSQMNSFSGYLVHQ